MRKIAMMYLGIIIGAFSMGMLCVVLWESDLQERKDQEAVLLNNVAYKYLLIGKQIAWEDLKNCKLVDVERLKPICYKQTMPTWIQRDEVILSLAKPIWEKQLKKREKDRNEAAEEYNRLLDQCADKATRKKARKEWDIASAQWRNAYMAEDYFREVR